MPIFIRQPESHPLRELATLQQRMDELFHRAFGPERMPWEAGVYPLVNLCEDQDHYYIRAELPGVAAQDLEITIQDNSLILRGERKIPTEEKEVNFHRREREAGFFRRVVALPGMVNPEKVEAACKDGILTIKLAKPEAVKPRKITVKTA
jgi:HSP20 family protein